MPLRDGREQLPESWGGPEPGNSRPGGAVLKDGSPKSVLHAPTLKTWQTASSSIFQSTFPLTLVQPKKNSCCLRS